VRESSMVWRRHELWAFQSVKTTLYRGAVSSVSGTGGCGRFVFDECDDSAGVGQHVGVIPMLGGIAEVLA
jgi:hypothetical protein